MALAFSAHRGKKEASFGMLRHARAQELTREVRKGDVNKWTPNRKKPQLDVVSQKPREQSVLESQRMYSYDFCSGQVAWMFFVAHCILFYGCSIEFEKLHVSPLGACTNKEEQAIL